MKKYFKFTVAGKSFPIDMLRHDMCFPVSTDDVLALHESLENVKNRYVITLGSHVAPTPERWKSFGWDFMSLYKFEER